MSLIEFSKDLKNDQSNNKFKYYFKIVEEDNNKFKKTIISITTDKTDNLFFTSNKKFDDLKEAFPDLKPSIKEVLKEEVLVEKKSTIVKRQKQGNLLGFFKKK